SGWTRSGGTDAVIAPSPIAPPAASGWRTRSTSPASGRSSPRASWRCAPGRPRRKTPTARFARNPTRRSPGRTPGRWGGAAGHSVHVARAGVGGGDFFVVTASPYGHAVLVLDVARDAGGRTALLLGQGYMPAQSFQVLRPSPSASWFVVDPGATSVATPFWV